MSVFDTLGLYSITTRNFWRVVNLNGNMQGIAYYKPGNEPGVFELAKVIHITHKHEGINPHVHTGFRHDKLKKMDVRNYNQMDIATVMLLPGDLLDLQIGTNLWKSKIT